MIEERYAQGTPCWVDLATSDQDATKAFCAELFGWSFQDSPMDDSGELFYSEAKKGKASVAGIYPQSEEEMQKGIAPHWDVHIAVDDIDAVVARVKQLGGTIVIQPFDVSDDGRIARIEDPTGAMLNFWQANQAIGADIKDEDGALVWAELFTSNRSVASDFLTELLGITADDAIFTGGRVHTVLSCDGAPEAGVIQLSDHELQHGATPYWLAIFQVADIDATVATALSIDASVVSLVDHIPNIGRLAVLSDPSGAQFGIFTPD